MKHFEDFTVGDTEQIPGRMISKEEILAFAREYDPQPHHLDEDAAKASILGALSASGWHTCCTLMRMIFTNPSAPAAFLGSPGVEEVRWKKPVFPGDELSATGHVVEARTSKSKPFMGLVKKRYEVTNQNGTLVMTMEVWSMIARRATGNAGGEAA